MHDQIHHMKLTDGGQISVPAAVRRRWGTQRVKITDAGDHLVVEPEPTNRFAALRGRIGPLDVDGDTLLRRMRDDEQHAEDRKLGER